MAGPCADAGLHWLSARGCCNTKAYDGVTTDLYNSENSVLAGYFAVNLTTARLISHLTTPPPLIVLATLWIAVVMAVLLKLLLCTFVLMTTSVLCRAAQASATR